MSPPQTCGTADWGDTTGGLEDGPAHGHLRQKCRAPGEGGGPGHGPSPRVPPAKRRPVGSTWRLRAHTRETASPFPLGGWWTVPEVEPALRLAPHSVPLGGDPATCRAGACT